MGLITCKGCGQVHDSMLLKCPAPMVVTPFHITKEEMASSIKTVRAVPELTPAERAKRSLPKVVTAPVPEKAKEILHVVKKKAEKRAKAKAAVEAMSKRDGLEVGKPCPTCGELVRDRKAYMREYQRKWRAKQGAKP